jgi:hypothetical protein
MAAKSPCSTLFESASAAVFSSVNSSNSALLDSEVLIHWDGLSPTDATRENLEDMQHRFPLFALEDKDNFKGQGVLRVHG